MERRTRAACALLAVLALGATAGGASQAPAAAAGGGPCHPIARHTANATRAFGTGSCPGVRPGGFVETDKGYCTLNFLFRGSNGARYIGTAGHCVVGEDLTRTDAGEHVWRKGPVAFDARKRLIGHFVYAILDAPKDFALIRLEPGVEASARMCEFGGPVRMSGRRDAPELLHYYGNGFAFGDVVPARTATALSMRNRNHIYGIGAIAPGDSGAGVIGDDGSALGLIVTVGLHYGGLRDWGTMGITRLPPQIARAERKLGIELRLLTAKLDT